MQCLDKCSYYVPFIIVIILIAGQPWAATLTWDPQTDPSVVGYMVHMGQSSGVYSSSIDVGPANSHVISNLVEGTTYYYAVTAYNNARAESGYSNEVIATIPYSAPVAAFGASATTGPAPLAINFTNGSTGSVTAYAWTFGDGTASSAQNPAHLYSAAGLYTVSLRVTGPGGTNTQTRTNYISVTSGGVADTTPPTVPSNVVAVAAGGTGINLTWTAATDNVGVTGYRVERCQGVGCTSFAQVAAPSGLAYSDTGMSPDSAYSYRVRATDAAGNLSAYSAVATARTSVVPDTTAPSMPTALVATANGSGSINLSWRASTDNVAVTGYRVERCQGTGCSIFAQIGTPNGTTFANSGLLTSTSYSYRVRATDAAGNVSAYSSTATATTGLASAGIAFVQRNYATPQSAQSAVPVTFTGAQAAGNLNVVVVGWNDSSAVVTAVTDAKGNVYTRAVGPTIIAGKLSQSVYYAKNIAAASANTNTVTVKFNVAARYADIRVLEYSGLDRVNPVDVVAAGNGSGTASSTPAVATTNANDLLFGASTVTSYNTGAGAGFTSRVITSPDGDIAEDRIVTSVGSYSATAPMTNGSWIMQMVAFRRAP